MNRLGWKEIVRKTKVASRKKRLGKKELSDLMNGVLAVEKFMGHNKSDFGDLGRKEVRKFNH